MILFAVTCFFVLAAPLALTSMALGSQEGSVVVCDLPVKQWLVGYGIASLVTSVIVCVSMHITLIVNRFMMSLAILGTVLGLVWFFVGGLVLIRICAGMYFMLIGSNASECFPIFLLVLNTLLGLVWFIMGGAVLLFRTNIRFFNEGVTYMVYALAMWCISAFYIVVVKT